MVDIDDWFTLGPPCMNCGERIPIQDVEVIWGPESKAGTGCQSKTVIFKGKCISKTCAQLPPGGNPFMYMVS